MSNYFYHGTTKKLVAVFGSLFNDIKICKFNSNGDVLKKVRVPLGYGPAKKFLIRKDAENGKRSNIAIKLPRISFEITGINYNSELKLNNRNKSNITGGKYTFGGVPYTINIQVSVMADNEDDSFQIVEQIIPHFSPHYTLSVKGLNDLSNTVDDVNITLNSVAPSDDYEGDFISRRVVLWTLDFTVNAKYYGPQQDSKLIEQVIVNLRDLDTAHIFETILEPDNE